MVNPSSSPTCTTSYSTNPGTLLRIGTNPFSMRRAASSIEPGCPFIRRIATYIVCFPPCCVLSGGQAYLAHLSDTLQRLPWISIPPLRLQGEYRVLSVSTLSSKREHEDSLTRKKSQVFLSMHTAQ